MALSIQASLGKIIMREMTMGSKFIRIKASIEDIGLTICKMVNNFLSSLIAKSIQVIGKKGIRHGYRKQKCIGSVYEG